MTKLMERRRLQNVGMYLLRIGYWTVADYNKFCEANQLLMF